MTVKLKPRKLKQRWESVTLGQAEQFSRESNQLSHRFDDPTKRECVAMHEFLRWPKLTVKTLQQLVSEFEPKAVMRTTARHLVRVGGRVPIAGGPLVKKHLSTILRAINEGQHPYQGAQSFSVLHPFTDGNGRASRALWAWSMLRANLIEVSRLEDMSFLQAWYLQSMQFAVDPRQCLIVMEGAGER